MALCLPPSPPRDYGWLNIQKIARNDFKKIFSNLRQGADFGECTKRGGGKDATKEAQFILAESIKIKRILNTTHDASL